MVYTVLKEFLYSIAFLNFLELKVNYSVICWICKYSQMFTYLSLVFHTVKLKQLFLFIVLQNNICSMSQWFMSLWNDCIAMVMKDSERLRRWARGIWEGHDYLFMVPGQMEGDMSVHRISYHMKADFGKNKALTPPSFY